MKWNSAFAIGLTGGLGVLLALAIGGAIGQISTVLLYAGAAIFLALGLEPVVQFLIRRKFPRWAAVLTIFLVILGALVGIGFIIVPVLIAQFVTLTEQIVDELTSGKFEEIVNWIETTFPGIDVDETISQIQSGLTDPASYTQLPAWVADIVQNIIGFVGSSIFALGGAFIVLVLTMYFTGSLPQLKSGMYRLVAASKRPKFIAISEEIMKSVGRFVTGQFTLGLINGVLTFTLMSIVGAKLALVYAFMAFVASTIPLVGTITASILITLLVLLLDGPQIALYVGIYYLIYMQIEAYVVSPRIMERAVKIPGVVVVLAALIGGTLLGIFGALVAIPLAAAVQVILREVVMPKQDAR
ncbi:AI-2E family transporter [Humidisolicoccus flavus]|uniref:AI-2E family transporter n=1 Tax=Humidisolicoccus flavus TaxID=3111414 RepID=UPI0032445503